MKPVTLRLVAFKDQMTGEIGLGLADMPRNDETNAANDGLLIAHDILEHQNGVGAIGTIDDELEALGGIWYVRGQHGELRRDRIGSRFSVHESIAADITRMFRDFYYGTPLDTNAPNTVECEADADLREILNCAVNKLHDELDGDELHIDVSMRSEEYMRVCLPRMRIGYEKAKARFEEYGRFFANDLFWEITAAIDPYCKQIDYEGQEFDLTFGANSKGRPFAHCEEFYGEDY